MILRRVIAHFRKQEWTAIFLDFAIVVSGVFMGIQVANWNEALKERAVAQEYLRRIEADLVADLRKFDSGDNFADGRLEQINRLIAAAENPESVRAAPEAFLIAIEKATWRAYEPVKPRAYAELVTTGKINLITPISVRDAIADYYSGIDRWEPIIAQQRAAAAFLSATAGLLSARQIAVIEATESDEPLQWTSDDLNSAVDIARLLSANAEAVRWLPQLYHQQLVVKSIDARHRRSAATLLALIRNGGSKVEPEPAP